AELIGAAQYDIELGLTDGAGRPGEETFRSTTTVTFAAQGSGPSFIDIVEAHVRSASLNGAELDVAGYDEERGIALPELGESNTVHVDADCRYHNTGEGLQRFVDPVDGNVYLYSQFETADAKRMFACFDQPDIKGVYQITVIAPRDWKVVSNAPVKATSETPEGAIRH